MLTALRERGFEVLFQNHAKAILSGDFPDAFEEVEAALLSLTIPIEEIVGSGGGETKGTQRLRRALSKAGWNKFTFEITKVINGVARESQSHEIDHVRTFPDGTRLALEIEWNNKDPFFDRDLENFKRLHAEGAISVGAIVTRGPTLQANLRALAQRFAEQEKLESAKELATLGLSPTARQLREYELRVQRGASFAEAWAAAFVQDKYGAATTHWQKLVDRISRGVGNPCPLLLIGLPETITTFGEVHRARGESLD
jgi:hypothetical protein